MKRSVLMPVIMTPAHIRNEWLVGGCLVVCLWLAEFVGVTQPLQRLVQTAVHPLQFGARQVAQAFVAPVRYGWSLQKAQRRILDLEQRYAESSALLGEMDSLQAENEALRKMIQATDTRLTQRVITTPILSYGHPLVAGGRLDGIQPGQLVLVEQTLMGVITEVSENQSQVALLFQEQTQPLVAKTESGVQGLVKGDGKRVVLTEIPVESQVKEGERVVTAGQEGIPGDVFIGRVVTVQANPQASTQTAVIEQIVSFYATQIVEVR
jgi:rod shape-determining protein MreC